MGRSRCGWALGVFAPWFLGACLVVSITADAGQESFAAGSLAPAAMRSPGQPVDLVPLTAALLPGAPGDPLQGRPLTQEASLAIGAAEDFKSLPDEIEPRKVMKRSMQAAPLIDRSRKGDPMIGLRPTFDTKLRRQGGGLAALRAGDMLFRHDETMPTGSFSAADGETLGPDSVAQFEPWPDGESPTTAPSHAEMSPSQGGSTVTMRPAAVNERLMQGATPVVPRAQALASTTPAAAEATPVEVVLSVPARGPAVTSVPAERPNYAALIEPERAAREKKCLAEGVYFEARSEPEQGQAAVAQVILNRAASGLYPSSICGVVYQNRSHYKACQFSFACEGKSLRVTEPEAWRTAVRIADAVTEGKTYLADVGASTHYHANYVRPGWARRLEKMDVIGHHIFYKLRPGQT